MNLVTVIPFAKSLNREHLTYFSASEIPVGSIVSVPLRKKTVEALVVDCQGAQAAKASVKSADFSLKKVKRVKGPSFFPPEFIEACTAAKDYFVSSTGSVLLSLVPAAILESHDKLERPPEAERRTPKNIAQEKYIFQSSLSDRLSSYRTLIRESFAKKQSVFLCLPTTQDMEYFRKRLQKGIEDYLFLFDASLPKKELVSRYNRLVTSEHPAVIIATGSFLFLPRQDIATYVFEGESSEAYVQMGRPHVDIRVIGEILAQKRQARCIFGDTLLRMETLWRAREQELGEFAPITFRLNAEAETEIIDMKEAPDGKPRPFEILSPELREELRDSLRRGEQFFLFTLRKGLSPTTVCNDCKAPVFCDACAAPLVLYSRKAKTGDISRIFACNRCRAAKDPRMTCPACGSWNLVPLGIGIELVRDILKEQFPEAKVFQFDKETVKSHKEAVEKMEAFRATPGAILLGTELALFYIEEPVKKSAVISLDSLFSIPYFRINERILRLLIKISACTESSLYIQTRNAKEPVLSHFVNGNLLSFYREEIRDRKVYDYPPATVMIKARAKVKKDHAEKECRRLSDDFAAWNPFVSAKRAKDARYAAVEVLLRVPREKWLLRAPDPGLLSLLRSLPPSYGIQIDPSDPY